MIMERNNKLIFITMITVSMIMVGTGHLTPQQQQINAKVNTIQGQKCLDEQEYNNPGWKSNIPDSYEDFKKMTKQERSDAIHDIQFTDTSLPRCLELYANSMNITKDNSALGMVLFSQK